MAAPAPRSVAVLGAGSWGTALAALIARHGHRAMLWGRDADVVAAIQSRHENPHYLPGITLPDTLQATTDLAAAMQGADLVLVVVPSHAFTETLHALAPHRAPHAGVAWATKGFEPGSGRFLHEVAAQVLGPDVPLAVVTGPSFAKEVAAGLPTALTVHSDDAAFAQDVADVLHGPAFRVYTGSDMRRRTRRGDEECPGRRHRGSRRHEPRPERTHRPDYARAQRNVAAQRGDRWARGNAHGPGRPRRPGADLHR
jgi:glycerol-3-phosphate dehydrogenase (NAD(P)+)